MKEVNALQKIIFYLKNQNNSRIPLSYSVYNDTERASFNSKVLF